MADDTVASPKAPASPVEAPPAIAAGPADDVPAVADGKKDTPAEPAAPADDKKAPTEKAEATTETQSENPAEGDAEMKDAEPEAPAPAPAAENDENASAEATNNAADGPATPSKSSKSRRKSTGPSDKSAKKLNRKASKAKLLHLDAKPGDMYFVKLKGYPVWPGIVCDEDMLPQALLKTRPVSTKRPDGTYREDFADGGKRAHERTFPMMYLYTYEFGWVPNSDLADLDPDTVMDVKMDKMRKDLQQAYRLASEKHSLEYYKDLLQQYQEDLLEKQKAQEAKEAKAQATPAKKSKKAKAEAGAEDEDVEMADADSEPSESAQKKSKKRKAEESAETPQRSESVKKPKIKLTVNSTPKTANGTGTTPKSSKPLSTSKPAKTKSKKPKEAVEKVATEAAVPKEPEISPEEMHKRKEKEVLFLRHKLQKGLLTKDQGPKEDEMKIMSGYVAKLEDFPDLEVSIIRATKINKVLKAILKMDSIPKEDEFKFKPRSQVLLDKWTKLLAVDEAPAKEATNGVNGTAAEAKSKTNGVKEKSEEAAEAAKEPPKSEEAEEKPAASEDTRAAEPVEASA